MAKSLEEIYANIEEKRRTNKELELQNQILEQEMIMKHNDLIRKRNSFQIRSFESMFLNPSNSNVASTSIGSGGGSRLIQEGYEYADDYVDNYFV